MNSDKQRVVVIGAGLAGLSAAYELSKKPNYHVTVLESESNVGGRVSTLRLDGVNVEIGGFMIFPWYKYYKKLARELGLMHKSRYSGNHNQYIQWDTGQPFRAFTTGTIFRALKPSLLLNFITLSLRGKINYYEPNLDYFGNISARRYLEQFAGPDSAIARIFDRLALGYTYPSIEEMPMTIAAGFARQVLLHRGFDRVKYLPGGASQLTESLARAIRDNGGEIVTESKVTSIKGGEVGTEQARYQADSVVLANGFEDKLLQSLLPDEIDIKTSYYTNDYVVVFEFANKPMINGEVNWMVAYTHSKTKTGLQMVSLGDIGMAMPDTGKNIVVAYVQTDKQNSHRHTLSEIHRFAASYIGKTLETVGSYRIIGTKHWNKTMPVVNLDVLRYLRDNQGKDNIYFAGDFLGSPCMETAVYTGLKAARLIIEQA
jgi:protoporphyrinogen oxidase